jgi:hypothetical protein
MDTLNKFLVFPWETFFSFVMQLSKRKTYLPISPTSLAEVGRSNVKKFHTNICFVQHSLAGWFNITVEHDAYREQSPVCFLK